MFDNIHKEMYRKNNFLNAALKIFETKDYNAGRINCLVGYEFNIECYKKYLGKYSNVQMEVGIEGTQIDVLADDIAIEAKCRNMVDESVVRQLIKYKQVYNDVRLFLPADTKVRSRSEIEKYAKIERSELTRQEIINRVLMMFKG